MLQPLLPVLYIAWADGELADAECTRIRELAGALPGLDEEAKTRLRELNQQISTLTTRFEKALLADTNDLAVHLDSESDLDGLSAGEISAAAEAAASLADQAAIEAADDVDFDTFVDRYLSQQA